MIKKRWCNSEEHGLHVEGCRCHYKQPHRRNGKTTFKFRSGNRSRTVTQHDVCYHNHGQHGHRMWNRDVSAAINIGCRFIAGAMGLDLGPWTRGRRNVAAGPSVGWKEIFQTSTPPTPLSHLFNIHTRCKKQSQKRVRRWLRWCQPRVVAV